MNVVSPWFTAPLTATALLAWVWVLRRRLLRRPVAWLVAAATVLTVLVTADGVNVYFGYLPRLSDVGDAVTNQHDRPRLDQVVGARAGARPDRHPDGVVVRLAIPDRGSGFGPSTSLVYLPPGYADDPTARYPVVYLFHGSPGTPGDWFQGGQAAQAASAAARDGRPAIVVAPQMSHSWLDDPECVDGVHERVETHLLRDVVPTVDASLRTMTDRADRVFGGMSAGGYCALNMGLRHRDLVGTVLDMSGFTGPTHTGGPAALFGPDPARTARLTAANSPATYAADLTAGPPLRIWFDVGASDREVRAEVDALVPVLRARGVDVQLHVRPGAHTFHVWAPALQQALPWALSGADRAVPDAARSG